MRFMFGFVFALSFGILTLISSPADACTNPEKDASNPTVTPGSGPGVLPETSGGTGTGTGGTPGGGLSETGGGTGVGGGDTGGGSGVVEGGGGGSTASDGGSSSSPGGGGFVETAGPGAGSEPVFGTGQMMLSWTPGKDVDADPANRAYFTHGGHRIATRLVVKDVEKKVTVLDELIPQYNDNAVTAAGTYPLHKSKLVTLKPGRYHAQVQSVFSRHGEIKFGLDGQWKPEGTISQRPEIPASKDGVRFAVVSSLKSAAFQDSSSDAGSAGCTGGAFAVVPGLFLLGLSLLLRRRLS